jgi:hypothetical protein
VDAQATLTSPYIPVQSTSALRTVLSKRPSVASNAFVTRIALRITFASLIRLVKQFDTNHDVAAIMVATLKWAQAAEREHDVKLADALLDVSIDEVLEQSGKSLTAARPPP